MFDDELDVFYSTDDFAHECTSSRPGESDQHFTGILSTVDRDLFDGHLVAGVHVLRYPTAAASLAVDDIVRTQRTVSAGEPPPAETWRVLRTPERVVDGAESDVHLVPEPDA